MSDTDKLVEQFPSLTQALRAEASAPPPGQPPMPGDLLRQFPSLAQKAAEEARPAESLIDRTSPSFKEFEGVVGRRDVDEAAQAELLAIYEAEVRRNRQEQADQVSRWRRELERDPEIQAGATAARRLVADYGGEKMLAALGSLGSHPDVVRGLVRMAQAMRGGRR